jgi:hypothetical protein
MATHKFTSFLSGGRSLHPTQRTGMVGNNAPPVTKAAGPVGLGNAPPIPPQQLGIPPVLNVSIAAASKGNVG